MSNKNDIFIYFDDQDNLSDDQNNSGWVTNFNRFLASMVGQIARYEPNVNTSNEGAVPSVEDLKDTAVFVFVISTVSAGSDNCTQAIENFKTAALKSGSTKSEILGPRIFKVMKVPVAQSEQAEAIQVYAGYDLYDFDIATGSAREINDFFSRNAEKSYWLKLVDLAYDISEVLMAFHEMDNGVKLEEINKIFLAETGPDLHTQRNIIKRELQRSGFEVLPKELLPVENTKDHIREGLKKSVVSIHLLGENILKQEGEDIVGMQNDVASELLKEQDKEIDFSRLIWISPFFRVTTDEQQGYLENLRRDVEETGNTEIFQTPFEDFRSIIRRTLSESSSSEYLETEETGSKKTKIYIVYEKSDSENLDRLVHHLESQDFEVLQPSFDGSLIDIRQQHLQNLVNMDAVIVYFGSVNEFWVKMKLLDILKSPGFGRLKSLNNIAIMGQAGESFDTQAFSNYNVTLIGKDDPTSKELDQFLGKIKES